MLVAKRNDVGPSSMTDEAWLDPAKGPSEKEIAFDYIKAPDFRVVWADGAIGSITPNGLIHFVLYAERQAIPRRQVFSIEAMEDGTAKLGEERLDKQISRGSVVREMGCDVFLSPQAATNLANWLLEQVSDLENLSKTIALKEKK
jgi:hypothetical protein